MEDNAPTAIMIGALATGHRDPLALMRAQLQDVTSYLRAKRTLIREYWRDETRLAAQFKSGEVAMAAAYPSTFSLARRLGANVGFTLPAEGRPLRTSASRSCPAATTWTAPTRSSIAFCLHRRRPDSRGVWSASGRTSQRSPPCPRPSDSR